MREVVLSTDQRGQPLVVRIGSTIRRPRGPGSDLAEAVLLHLEAGSFEGSPRFLGHDTRDRQVLSFVDGEVSDAPAWLQDDATNAQELGRIATLVRAVHDAMADFVAGPGLEPIRPLPVSGSTWSHGDVGYQNVVYRAGQPVALIDWEFVAPADVTCDLAGLLALGVRAPRPDVADNDRRRTAVSMAFESVIAGYGLDERSAARLPLAIAAVLDDAADFWGTLGRDPRMISSARWRADWFRAESEL